MSAQTAAQTRFHYIVNPALPAAAAAAAALDNCELANKLQMRTTLLSTALFRDLLH
jgi:hypothetical protein